MANIPRKFLKEITYEEITKTEVGISISETKVIKTLSGSIFPLNGKERTLELQGLIRKGTMKLYTNDRINETKDIYITHNGLKYKLSKIIGDFPTDTLNTYYMEVQE